MNIKLRITLKNCEGALVRLLGTIERRGHHLVRLDSGHACGRHEPRDLDLEIDCGERSPDVLLRQVRRLYDVLSAAWYQCPRFEADGASLGYETTRAAMYGLVVHREESGEGGMRPATAERSAAHG